MLFSVCFKKPKKKKNNPKCKDGAVLSKTPSYRKTHPSSIRQPPHAHPPRPAEPGQLVAPRRHLPGSRQAEIQHLAAGLHVAPQPALHADRQRRLLAERADLAPLDENELGGAGLVDGVRGGLGVGAAEGDEVEVGAARVVVVAVAVMVVMLYGGDDGVGVAVGVVVVRLDGMVRVEDGLGDVLDEQGVDVAGEGRAEGAAVLGPGGDVEGDELGEVVERGLLFHMSVRETGHGALALRLCGLSGGRDGMMLRLGDVGCG